MTNCTLSCLHWSESKFPIYSEHRCPDMNTQMQSHTSSETEMWILHMYWKCWCVELHVASEVFWPRNKFWSEFSWQMVGVGGLSPQLSEENVWLLWLQKMCVSKTAFSRHSFIVTTLGFHHDGSRYYVTDFSKDPACFTERLTAFLPKTNKQKQNWD